MLGRILSSYEILEKIGQGGMGEVYRAKDLELGRDVAIKVLPEDLACDSERSRRFEREARTASALNHPNIATIHHIGDHEGIRYIVMELVEGKTLRELLNESPLSAKQTLDIAKQIAGGLAKAHAAGIVHRDLKPENLMVTEDGLVKILDFGLAKLVPQGADVDHETDTVTKATQHGTILGTVQYMSPEQAAGRAVDFRSDQFSFGSILYEMLTGQRAFHEDTTPQTLAAIIGGEPEPIKKLNDDAPVELLTIVERCLSKDPDERYDETKELAAELESVPDTASMSRRTRRRVLWLAAAVVSASLVFGLRDWVSSKFTSSAIDSIAVLPLQNLSGDLEHEYFADGMTEALMTDLAKIEALKVISRRSVMRYKGSDQPLAEIAGELDVDVIVEGSALRAGDRVRITAQLIDPETEQALWAESYERDLQDVLLLQSEIAQAIAGEIQVAITPEDSERLARARPIDPEAHEAYLKGRFHRQKLTETDLDAAMSYFERALEKDPDYAPAYLGISRVWGGRRQMTFATPREATREARAALLKAMELDDSIAEAHSALALQKTWGEWDWSSAEQAFRRAIELDPNHAETRAYYAHFLDIMGRPEEAIPQAERAQELDPIEPLYRALYAVHLTYLRRYDDAIAEFRKADLTARNQAFALNILTEALHDNGMYEEALDAQKSYFASIEYPEGEEALTQGYAEDGYTGAMRRAADALAERGRRANVGAKIAASLYVRAGENELALDWLERAFDNRDPGLPYLVWPVFDGLRDDPRFGDLLHRMNLPQ